MKLKEYKKLLDNLISTDPKCLNYEVIYSHDDEGNEYQKVDFISGFVAVSNIHSDRFLDLDGEKTNAIIIN